MSVYAVIVAAGSGRRMGRDLPKQFLDLSGRPILAHTLDAFERAASVQHVVLVTSADGIERCEDLVRAGGFHKVVAVVPGGEERQDSVAHGLDAVGEGDVIAIHDGVRPLIRPGEIDAVVEAARREGAAVLATPITDTVKQTQGDRITGTLDRSRLWTVQTPQAFRADVIRRAHADAGESGNRATDDSALVENLGVPVKIVAGSPENIKITTPEDLKTAERILQERQGEGAAAQRIGQGYDVHRLVEGRPLILGGVQVPFDRGLAGHSDADVLSHAVADAVLGGLGVGDIGRHFPDTDSAYAGISSLVLLEHVADLIREEGAEILNVDATVLAQRPRLAAHIPEMRSRIAEALTLSVERVSVKATTTEGLGSVGREEGIAAQAVALLRNRP